MTPTHKGQYMSSLATSNKVKLGGFPDNSPGVRGPYNEASPSLGRAQLRGWLVCHLLCPYPAGKRHTGQMVWWRQGTEFNSQIAQSDIFQRRWPAWSAWSYLTWGASRQSGGRSAGRLGGVVRYWWELHGVKEASKCQELESEEIPEEPRELCPT